MPRRYFRLFAFAAALAAVVPVVPVGAQRTLSHVHNSAWGEAEGLPYLAMDHIVRSADGYLWLGGPGPLVRFDGVRFKVFDASNTPALKSAVTGGIRPLLSDRDGTMWVLLSDGGLVRYRDGRFKGAIQTPSGASTRLALDSAGITWVVAERSGLYRAIGDSLQLESLPPWLPNTELLTLISHNGNGVWLGTRNLGVVHLASGAANAFRPPGVSGPALPILHARDGSLWVWARGLHVLSDGRWRSLDLPVPSEQVFQPIASEANDGAVWIGTRGRGVIRVKGDRVEQFTRGDGLSDAVTTGLHLDAEGIAWIATTSGINRLRPVPFSPLGPTQGLPFDFPVWIAPDASGAVWALTAGVHNIFKIEGGIASDSPTPVRATALRNPPNAVYYPLIPARAGGLWVYDNPNGRIVRATGEHTVPAGLAIPGLNVLRMREDSRGNLWFIPLTGRLQRAVAGKWTAVGSPQDVDLDSLGEFVELDNRRLLALRRDKPGLVLLDDGKVVRRVGAAGGVDRALHNITIDGVDTLWAHDRDSALYRIIGDNVTRVTSPELVPLLRMGAVLMPASDRLFIATIEAITSVPRAALHAAADRQAPFPPLRRYTALDGAHGKGLTTPQPSPVFRGADGRVWFATPRGLLVFDVHNDVSNRVVPRVHIEEVRAGDSALARDSVVTVPAGSERLEFLFTVTALRMPERARVEFRLEGVDSDWRMADASRRVTYTQLRPRTYVFRVRGWNEEGVPAQSEAVQRLHVLPLWHQSWWFLSLMVTAALGATSGTVAIVLRARARRAADRLAAGFEATLAERTRLAGELHDTLLQAFTGVTLQLQALRKRIVASPAEVEQDIGRVLLVADEALRDARYAVWDMRAPDLGGSDVAAALEASTRDAIAAHRMASGDEVAFEVRVSGQRRRLSNAVENAALRICGEAVANALHHAKPARITVEVVFEPRHFCMDVRDDGIGFDPAHHKPSEGRGHWGLVGMQERARKAGGTLAVASVPGSGTSLSLRLPLEAA